jgi:hypothetical protein
MLKAGSAVFTTYFSSDFCLDFRAFPKTNRLTSETTRAKSRDDGREKIIHGVVVEAGVGFGVGVGWLEGPDLNMGSPKKPKRR